MLINHNKPIIKKEIEQPKRGFKGLRGHCYRQKQKKWKEDCDRPEKGKRKIEQR